MEVVDDSENRITVGGKRKSSNRRSSILKATKSPLKSGPLEDLDPNSLDDKGRSKSKKARRSSGRRVSFAEKNEVKEFFTEDWQSAWKKEVEKNNRQMSSSTNKGEYQEPAESIKGFETLLNGDIQADQEEIYKAEIQNLPEVKFQNISEGNEANAIIKYDKGFYIQSIKQGQIQQASSEDVTACHGIKIISHSYSGPMFPNTHAGEQEEEMDYTKCFSSNQFAQNTAKDVETGDGEQTRIFSENVAGIKLDETCSQQEIFRSHLCLPPSSQTSLDDKEQKIDATPFLASLKSGTSRSYEKSGDDFKIDSTSFPVSLHPRLSGIQMSEGGSSYAGTINLKRQPFVELADQNINRNRTLQQSAKCGDDLELTTCHSSGEINDDHICKRDRRSIYEAADVDVTVCFGSGLSYQKDYPPQELPVAEESQIFVDDGEEELNVTACHGGIIIDGNHLKMFGMESGKQEEVMEHTKCFSTSQFIQTMATSVELGSPEQTKIFSEDAGVDLDVTCSRRDNFLQNYPEEEKRDATAFLASLKSSSLKSPEKDIFQQGDKISHSFLEQKSACVQKSESGSGASGNISIEQRPFGEITHDTTLPKYGTQQESTNENIELTTCYNYEVQTKTEKSKRRSIYEPADVDETTCFGSGLINSPDSIELRGRIHETSKQESNYCTGLNSIGHLGDQKDATILRCHALETRSNATDYQSFVTHETREAYEQAGQLDLTKCCGGIILPNKQGTDHVSFPSRSADTLDFTNCYGQDSLFTRPSSSQTHQNNNTDSCKIDTSAFLASLNKSSEAAVLDRNDDMDLTATFTAGSATSSSKKFRSVDSKHHIIEDDNLEFTACHSHKGIENNVENSKRKSIYEPADLDITSCYGPGFSRSSTMQALNDSMNSTLHVAPTNHKAAIDRSCDSSVLNKTQNFPVTRQHKQEEFETDLSKCRTRVHNIKIKNYFRSSEVGLMASFRAQPVSSSDQQVTSISPYKILKMPSRKGSAAEEQNSNTTLDATPGMQGHIVVEPLDESRLELTTCCNYKICENNEEFYGQKMQPQMEESRLEFTTCHKYEVFHNDEDLQCQKIAQQLEEPRQEVGICQSYVNTPDNSQNLQNQTIPQYLEETKLGLKDCGINELQSNDKDVQSQPMPGQLTAGKEDLQNHTFPQYFKESQLGLSDNNQSNEEELQVQRMPEQLDVCNRQDLLSQTMPQIMKESTEEITTTNCDSEIPDSTEDLPRQMTTHQLAESSLQLNATCPDQEDIDYEQITSKYNDRKLSIIQETDSELTNNQEQNITRRSITLKEFLDLTEIVFITDVNTRRSMAVLPSNVKQSDLTQKDKVVSSLVTAPKIKCYEETISAVESQITEMKEKVRQQEEDINAENPVVFMEAQSASKQELMAMRNNTRRLRSACEKKAAREWKEGKYQMNKRILSDLKKNRQSLAADLRIVGESLTMVDDCFKLLEKVDKELDEGIARFQLSIDESEKKLQDQTNKKIELEAKKEALEKGEKEILELESTRDNLQREKQELENTVDQRKQKLRELEENIRLRQEQFKVSKAEDNAKSRRLRNEYNLLESLHEWELDEWDQEHAKFTFFKESVEMVVFFKPKGRGVEGSIPDQEVQSLQLNFSKHINSYQRCVHAAINQRTNQSKLAEMCPTRNSLPEVLYHMSWILYDSKCIGDELFRIGLKHLTTLEGNRFSVLFSSLEIRFVLHVQLEFESYPEGVSFTVARQWGDISQAEIEQTLKTVNSGQYYLSRLVEACEEITHQAISSSSP